VRFANGVMEENDSAFFFPATGTLPGSQIIVWRYINNSSSTCSRSPMQTSSALQTRHLCNQDPKQVSGKLPKSLFRQCAGEVTKPAFWFAGPDSQYFRPDCSLT
jgi:hypothetical protein